MAEATTPRPSADPYRVLLTQGALYTTGLQLANVAAVLPFLLAQEGIYWAAGLLYPAYSIGIVVGNSLSPVVVERAARLEHLVIATTTAAMAVLVVACGVASWVRFHVAWVFLGVSLLSGVVAGISRVAWSEVISGKLVEDRRNNLVFAQGAIGALIAVITTLMLLPFLADRDPAHSHLDVLWLGASSLLAAAIAAMFIGPVRTAVTRDAPVSLSDTYRQGLSTAREHPWFRRYALVQLLFVPVSLGTSFYSIHASVNHSDTAGSVHVLVISSSIGLIAGSLLWRGVSRHGGVRGLLVTSAVLGSLAAVLCVLTEAFDDEQYIWLYGMVFILATISNQAIFSAGLTWVAAYAPERHRATLLGFGALLVAVSSTVVGAALGAVAHQVAVIGPILTILVLNVLAGAVAVWAAPKRLGAVA